MKETPETRVQSLGEEDSLEEDIATHSSVLACRTSWTEEPAGHGPQGRKEWDMTETTQQACTQKAFRKIKAKTKDEKEKGNQVNKEC